MTDEFHFMTDKFHFMTEPTETDDRSYQRECRVGGLKDEIEEHGDPNVEHACDHRGCKPEAGSCHQREDAGYEHSDIDQARNSRYEVW